MGNAGFGRSAVLLAGVASEQQHSSKVIVAVANEISTTAETSCEQGPLMSQIQFFHLEFSVEGVDGGFMDREGAKDAHWFHKPKPK